jgi:hypothetical protein
MTPGPRRARTESFTSKRGSSRWLKMPRERVESFVARPETPGLSSLEARFLQRVVAAMADYATARTGPLPPVSAGEEGLEGFEGLTTLDILELTQRLDSLFDHPSVAEKPPVPPPAPVRKSESIELLEKMLAESLAPPPPRPPGRAAAAPRSETPPRPAPPPPRRSGS